MIKSTWHLTKLNLDPLASGRLDKRKRILAGTVEDI